MTESTDNIEQHDCRTETSTRGAYSRRNIEDHKRPKSEAPIDHYATIRKLNAFLASRGIAANIGTWSKLGDAKPPAMRHATPQEDGGKPDGPRWQSKWVKRAAAEPGRIKPAPTRMEDLRAIADSATRSGLIWRANDKLALGYVKPKQPNPAAGNVEPLAGREG